MRLGMDKSTHASIEEQPAFETTLACYKLVCNANTSVVQGCYRSRTWFGVIFKCDWPMQPAKESVFLVTTPPRKHSCNNTTHDMLAGNVLT